MTSGAEATAVPANLDALAATFEPPKRREMTAFAPRLAARFAARLTELIDKGLEAVVIPAGQPQLGCPRARRSHGPSSPSLKL